MTKDFSIVVSGSGFELSDADALATLASRILGEKKYEDVCRRTITLPNGMANDRMVDEVLKVLNRPLVRIAMRISS